MADGCSFFAGRQAALLTKHQKELVIKPVFEKDTGCEVLVNTSFDTDQQAEEFARRIGFPAHWLVLRPDDDSHEFIIKGVNTWQSLGEGFRKALDNSSTGAVFLETDMRAHANPTRMVNIQKAAEDLVQKIKQHCPRCRVPGFSLVKTRRGLPCEWCERPTGEVKAWVYGCNKCGFTREKRVSRSKRASAGNCPRCNP